MTARTRCAAFVLALSLAGLAPELTSAVATQGDPTSCKLSAPDQAKALGAGTVAAFEKHEDSVARIASTEKNLGGHIEPAYADNLRVVVNLDSGETEVFIAPANMQVRVGDRVTVQSLARSKRDPCGYVPPLIETDLGAAQPQGK